MKYQQRLQVAVRERLRKLMTAPYSSAGHEVHLAVTWINSQPALKGLLEEAAQAEPDLDSERFRAGLTNGQLSWPSRTEEGQASLIWKLMQEIAKDEVDNPDIGWQTASGYSMHKNIQDNWREFAEDILQPLFGYLSERVGAESSILHTLERYRTRIEWFDREELYARFEADHANGEEVYNLDLQRFLFLEGDHVTHAKPRSASGEADLVGELDGRDPLVCDGKIFDGSGRGKGYLVKGLHQIIKYAHDYGQHTAYLVIYNISDRLLELPTDGTPGAWPPYTELAGVRVYFIHVRVLPPTTTASKAGKATRVTLTHDDLTSPDTT
uniref:Restriction endonuclease n=1 Tax=Streptomyces sp. NBC_00003 TaxID=2903608 RepID=A0AAU2UVP3_9ACTN